MAPISLKIVLDDGAVTRKVKFDTTTKVQKAHTMVQEKMMLPDDGKEYGLFLRSADDDLAGVWLEDHRTLDYYMLRDGDSLDYICKIRNLRVKMLDGTLKTLQVDEGKPLGELMFTICSKIGITNHEEYGLCPEIEEIVEETNEKEKEKPLLGTLTLKRKNQQRERDVAMEQLSKKLKTDDNVEWLDQHRTLREMGVDPKQTLLLKRRLFYSDRNVDSRDPVQLNLLYVQTRDAILEGHHPVTEEQAADCKIRWINIRDVNRRILRKQLKEKDRPSRPYKYETELMFMRPFYKDVLPMTCSDTDDRPYEEEWVEDCEVALNDSDDSEKPIKKKAKTRKSVKKKKEPKYEEEIPASTSFSELPSDFDPADPVDAFLLSIGATLKTFSPYHLNVAKSKIFSVVQEHDLQQIVQKQQQEVPIDTKATSETMYLS